MRIEITHVRYAGTTKTEQTISQYQWRELDTRTTGAFGKHALIAWLSAHQGSAYVGTGQGRVPLRIANTSPRYVETRTGGPGATLTSLPEF